MIPASRDLAPIVIFAYNRADRLLAMIQSLQCCVGFERSSIFVFVDGPKSADDAASVEEVRALVKGLSLSNVHYDFSETNKGLRNSVYEGVSRIVTEYGRVIVLEDDLLLSPIALSYFNGALDRYAKDECVWSVSSYIPDVPALRD